jgi:hypothetical protein
MPLSDLAGTLSLQRRLFLKLAAGSGFAAVAGRSPVVFALPASGLTLASAVNKAGRQRMLSQRAAKAWLMLLAKVEPDRAGRILKDSTALFDRQLAELATLQPGSEIAAALAQQKLEWQKYRPLLTQPPSAAAAEGIYAANEAVLAAAHRTTLAYEKELGGSFGRLINVAGRQRMLSQRMAKFYYFSQLGVKGAESTAGLAKARKEFGQAHAELMAAQENSASLTAELGLVQQQWFFFQNALEQTDHGESLKAAATVATTSERILEQLNLCVGLYEELATGSA